MLESSRDALPTPMQIESLSRASWAAWQARRMREAERAVVTGNVAMAVCVIGANLVLMRALADEAAPLLVCGITIIYVAFMIFSIRWMMRNRDKNPVTVIDHREAAARAAVAKPVRLTIMLAGLIAFQIAITVFWATAFHLMPEWAIYLCLAIGPIAATAYFLVRFTQMQFWEDLIFAASVLIAYLPFFLPDSGLTLMSPLSLVLAAVGMFCLHRRWVAWSHTVGAIDEKAPSAETTL